MNKNMKVQPSMVSNYARPYALAIEGAENDCSPPLYESKYSQSNPFKSVNSWKGIKTLFKTPPEIWFVNESSYTVHNIPKQSIQQYAAQLENL